MLWGLQLILLVLVKDLPFCEHFLNSLPTISPALWPSNLIVSSLVFWPFVLITLLSQFRYSSDLTVFFFFNKKKFDSVSKTKLTSLFHYMMKLFFLSLYSVHNFFQLKSIKDKNRWNQIAQVLTQLTNCLDCFFFVSWPFFFFFSFFALMLVLWGWSDLTWLTILLFRLQFDSHHFELCLLTFLIIVLVEWLFFVSSNSQGALLDISRWESLRVVCCC